VSGKSSIEWTDASWNPMRGCRKVSPGCKHCYAERFAERFRGTPGHPYERGFEPRVDPSWLSAPLHWRAPRLVFVNSMTDLFLEDFSSEEIAAVFGVMACCPQHTFQVLTKRASRLPEWFRWIGEAGATAEAAALACVGAAAVRVGIGLLDRAPPAAWPLPNVWLGVSVEDPEYAAARIPHLLAVPAAVHFVSYEPALGLVDFRPYVDRGGYGATRRSIDWIIMGGESGPGARPMMGTWARLTRNACEAAGVPFFFKQWGGLLKKKAGRELDGRVHDGMPRRAT